MLVDDERSWYYDALCWVVSSVVDSIVVEIWLNCDRRR